MSRSHAEHGDEFDVIVMGGGLAGLCLAIQLLRGADDLRVLVLDRGESVRPEAAHRVGESSVEVASHYFRNVLAVDDLIAKEVPKFGLRFFFSDGSNRDIAQRLEFGPKHFLTMPSDQIDRGQFENGLADRAQSLGVEIRYGCRITGVEMADVAAQDPTRRRHRVRYVDRARDGEVVARWVVDASGRSGILKKKLGVGRPSRHHVNAAWFRIDHPIDVDDWTTDRAFASRAEEPRRLSTNHFMGEGYWVWFIPLAHDRTSVGIVAEEARHPFSEFQTFEKSLAWLEAHEPQAAAVVRAHDEQSQRMDFLALKSYSRDAKQVFSADGWALTGDAGIFIDPLYSPGSDFIAMSNSFISDLIVRDHRGEAVERVAAAYDKAYRSLAQTYLVNYYRQYSLMGDARVMVAKICWDFTMYWGGVAILFCGDRFCDPQFMARVNPILQSFAFTNLSMQAYFREWAKHGHHAAHPGPMFIDYAGLDFLAELNANLAVEYDDEALIAQMERNLLLAKDLRLEIQAEASRNSPTLARDDGPAMTGHLEKVFERIRANAAMAG